MSDTKEPLDTAAIEARLAAISLDSEWLEVVKSKPRHLLVYTEEDEVFELPKEFIANAPTDIAALVAEVKRLREGQNNVIGYLEAFHGTDRELIENVTEMLATEQGQDKK